MAEILLITRPLTPPWDEGSKNIAWHLASRAKQNHYHILTTEDSGLSQDLQHITLRNVYSSGNLNITQQLRLLWFLTTRSDSSIDIYHTIFVPTPVTSSVVSVITRVRNKKFIQTVPSLYRDITPRIARRIFTSDRVIALSDWTAEKLADYGIKHILRINAGVDVEKFSPSNDKNEQRTKYRFHMDMPLVLYSGELTRLGSLPIMLSVVRQVLSSTNDIQFLFACPTRLPEDFIARKNAIRQIQAMGFSERVHFLGDVNDFSELLRICDMLVYPVSNMAGKIDTPLTVLEAMATELPLIISDLPPLNEVLKESAGIAVQVDDERAFTEAIIEMAKDPVLRKELGKRGREVVIDNFNISKMVHSYERLYREFD